ncbi:MAG: thiamine phosphate synthase [Dokdonella sp.]
MFNPRGLYAIANGLRADLYESTSAALAGGARVIQYRDKTLEYARQDAEAAMLARLCASQDIPLIIDEDIELALRCGAAGVHLDVEADIASARVRLGEHAVIGVSCLDSIDRARRAVDNGASYVSFGVFYASPTKPNAPHARLTTLIEAKSLGVPVVAIGGITPDNASPLIAAGADCVAVISSLFDATDIEAVAREFSQLFS